MTSSVITPQQSPHCPQKPRKGEKYRLNEIRTSLLTVIALLLFILIFLVPFIQEGIPFFPESTNLFSSSYGTKYADDNAQALLQTHDGSFILTGITWSYGAGQSDVWLIKTNKYGVILWNRTFGGRDKDWASAVVETADSGFVLVGRTWSVGAGQSDMWIIKTDRKGFVQWQQTVGGSGDDEAYDIIQTNDGGLALAGYTYSLNTDTSDMYLVKLDSNGTLIWSRTYGGVGNERCFTLIQTLDGGYALGGRTNSFGEGYYDMYLVKTDFEGYQEWDHTYGNIGRDQAFALLQTPEGGFALAGETQRFDSYYRDFWLVKTDDIGTLQWSQTYGTPERELCFDLVQTPDKGFVLAGYQTSLNNTNGFVDLYIVKSTNNGVLEWERTYGGPLHDLASAIVRTDDGGFAVAGITNAPWFYPYYGGGDMWLLKLDAKGRMTSKNNAGLLLMGTIPVVTIVVYLINYKDRMRKIRRLKMDGLV